MVSQFFMWKKMLEFILPIEPTWIKPASHREIQDRIVSKAAHDRHHIANQIHLSLLVFLARRLNPRRQRTFRGAEFIRIGSQQDRIEEHRATKAAHAGFPRTE